jgi:hypothetical protein
MTLPANIRVNASAPFPASVKGSGVVTITKANGIWTIGLNFGLVPVNPNAPDPANLVLLWNPVTGVFSLVAIGSFTNQRLAKILTGTGLLVSPYAALPGDDVLIVKQAVGAPFTVTVDWSQRTRPLRVVDGKGDANVNPITITPKAGQTQLAALNYSCVINGQGASINLTPLPDGSGAY